MHPSSAGDYVSFGQLDSNARRSNSCSIPSTSMREKEITRNAFFTSSAEIGAAGEPASPRA